MDREEAKKLIDEVQAVGSARGWNMFDKLLDLIDRVEKIEREACAKVCDFEVCGSQGFAGPTCCILPPGHGGEHKYGVPMAKTQRDCSAAIRARSNVEVSGRPLADGRA